MDPLRRLQPELDEVNLNDVIDAWKAFERMADVQLSEEQAFRGDVERSLGWRHKLSRDVLRGFAYFVSVRQQHPDWRAADTTRTRALNRILRGIDRPFHALLALAVSWITCHPLLAIRGAGWVSSVGDNPYRETLHALVRKMSISTRIDDETRQALMETKQRVIARSAAERPTIVNTPHVYAGHTADRLYLRDLPFDLSANTDSVQEEDVIVDDTEVEHVQVD